jgi:protein ImuB
MGKRFMSIFLPHLQADIRARRCPELRERPFALAEKVRNRMLLCSVNRLALQQGIYPGMAVADARAMLPDLELITDELPDIAESLRTLAIWCQRFTPFTGIDFPDGILLDISGCSHLWGGELPYQQHILQRLREGGIWSIGAIADTIGAAWALARFAPQLSPLPAGQQASALQSLPVAALRLDTLSAEKLNKLGLYRIQDCLKIPRAALKRRLGTLTGQRLDQATGALAEDFDNVSAPAEYASRLPCPEPIRTAEAIALALQQLLQALCNQLKKDRKGLRSCLLQAYRIDGQIQSLEIKTGQAQSDPTHLHYLFSLHIERIAPGLGIELFTLEAPLVEALPPEQELLWRLHSKESTLQTSVLLDKIRNYLPLARVQRFMPEERYWPEHAVSICQDLQSGATTTWPTGVPRPIQLLQAAKEITVMVPIPDYPPVQFQLEGVMHRVVKADGPERIEAEWWLHPGTFRDYYFVEDEKGRRYWLYREGPYDSETTKWYLHGFFA